MATARQRDAWDRASLIWCTIANANRGKDTRPFHPADVHPYRVKADYGESVEQDHTQRRLMLLPDTERKRVEKILAERQRGKQGRD